MRAVIQRVISSEVNINDEKTEFINKGLLVLVGIEDSDDNDDINWLVKKIINLRIFDDKKGVMNLSVQDIKGDIMIISQFTLHASTKKGNRPSYIKASKPEVATPMYNKFVEAFSSNFSGQIKTGEFGADMKISLINDGPVTIIIDTKSKE